VGSWRTLWSLELVQLRMEATTVWCTVWTSSAFRPQDSLQLLLQCRRVSWSKVRGVTTITTTYSNSNNHSRSSIISLSLKLFLDSNSSL